MLQRNTTALSSHINKTEDSHIRKLIAKLNTSEQKEANSPWISRCQEIINLRAESNKIETRKTIQKNQCNKDLVFRGNQQDRQNLSKLMKKQRKRDNAN